MKYVSICVTVSDLLSHPIWFTNKESRFYEILPLVFIVSVVCIFRIVNQIKESRPSHDQLDSRGKSRVLKLNKRWQSTNLLVSPRYGNLFAPWAPRKWPVSNIWTTYLWQEVLMAPSPISSWSCPTPIDRWFTATRQPSWKFTKLYLAKGFVAYKLVFKHPNI